MEFTPVGRLKLAVPEVNRAKQVPSEAVESITATAPVPIASIEQFPEVMITEFAGDKSEKFGPPKVMTERVSAITVARETRERLKTSRTITSIPLQNRAEVYWAMAVR